MRDSDTAKVREVDRELRSGAMSKHSSTARATQTEGSGRGWRWETRTLRERDESRELWLLCPSALATQCELDWVRKRISARNANPALRMNIPL